VNEAWKESAPLAAQYQDLETVKSYSIIYSHKLQVIICLGRAHNPYFN